MSKVINNSKINIAQELTLLRSAVIGLIGKDPEGEYKPEFVKKVLRALNLLICVSFTEIVLREVPKRFQRMHKDN